MGRWVERQRRPVLPLYFAAAACLVCALALPVYRGWAFLVTALLSAAAYLLGVLLCPTRVVRYEEPYATGSAEVDKMLEGIVANLDALHSLNEAIPDEALSEQLTRMEKAGRGIVREVDRMPEKAPAISRFARYYLPEVVRIVGSYAHMQDIPGENAARVLEDVHRNAGIIANAFENQLDDLYSSEALDISTDLEVLDGILKSQNLAK